MKNYKKIKGEPMPLLVGIGLSSPKKGIWQGDQVECRNKGYYWSNNNHIFVAEFEGKFICKDSDGLFLDWDEIRPLQTEQQKLFVEVDFLKQKAKELGLNCVVTFEEIKI